MKLSENFYSTETTNKFCITWVSQQIELKFLFTIELEKFSIAEENRKSLQEEIEWFAI